MKKLIITLTLNIFLTYLYSQTPFNQGYEIGYKNGYCHNQSTSCISPVPPVPPIPTINESSNNYTDGYNRGFESGLNAQKIKNNSSSNNSRLRYTTSQSNSIDWVQRIDRDDAIAKGLALRELKGKAINAYKEGECESSLDMANIGLKYLNKDWEFYYIRAESYLCLEKYDDAIQDIKKIILYTDDSKIEKYYQGILADVISGKYQKDNAE